MTIPCRHTDDARDCDAGCLGGDSPEAALRWLRAHLPASTVAEIDCVIRERDDWIVDQWVDSEVIECPECRRPVQECQEDDEGDCPGREAYDAEGDW